MRKRQVRLAGQVISLIDVALDADVTFPAAGSGMVVFAHGSGSSRLSPRNRLVAETFQEAGLGTVLVDLLTPEEDQGDPELRFDIGLLAGRVTAIVDWLGEQAATAETGVGLFGASTGAAAALIGAAQRPQSVRAVVSRGGRPDLAGPALARPGVPTLLIVGGRDAAVLELNRMARELLGAHSRLEVVPGATHLFEEPGALERVATLARDWMVHHLGPAPAAERRWPPPRLRPGRP